VGRSVGQDRTEQAEATQESASLRCLRAGCVTLAWMGARKNPLLVTKVNGMITRGFDNEQECKTKM